MARVRCCFEMVTDALSVMDMIDRYRPSFKYDDNSDSPRVDCDG